MLAWTHLIDAWLGFSESHTESIKQAVELAKKTGALDDILPEVHKSLERSRKNKSNSLFSTVGLADVYMQLGREEEARAYAAEVLKIDPTFSLEGFRRIYSFKDPAHLEPILNNLRKAGLK